MSESPGTSPDPLPASRVSGRLEWIDTLRGEAAREAGAVRDLRGFLRDLRQVLVMLAMLLPLSELAPALRAGDNRLAIALVALVALVVFGGIVANQAVRAVLSRVTSPQGRGAARRVLLGGGSLYFCGHVLALAGHPGVFTGVWMICWALLAWAGPWLVYRKYQRARAPLVLLREAQPRERAEIAHWVLGELLDERRRWRWLARPGQGEFRRFLREGRLGLEAACELLERLTDIPVEAAYTRRARVWLQDESLR